VRRGPEGQPRQADQEPQREAEEAKEELERQQRDHREDREADQITEHGIILRSAGRPLYVGTFQIVSFTV
jgi:hypothetical protein